MLGPNLEEKSSTSSRAAALELPLGGSRSTRLVQSEQVPLSQHEAETSLWRPAQ